MFHARKQRMMLAVGGLLGAVLLVSLLIAQQTDGKTANVATGGTVAPAAQPDDMYNGVSQSALKNCIERNKGHCEDEVPGLKECMAARKQCNRSEPDRTAANRPEGQGAGQPARMTEDEAKQLALSAATNPTDPANSTAAKQMTVAQLQADGQLQNTDVPKGVKVWVVTVHAKRMTLASPTTPAREVGLYTVIINAVTKAPIDDCLGEGCYAVD